MSRYQFCVGPNALGKSATVDEWLGVLELLRPHVDELPTVTSDRLWSLSYHKFTGDPLAVQAVLPSGWAVSLDGKELPGQVWSTIVQQLQQLNERLQAPATVVNERCNVVVPDLGLLAIRSVRAEYDLCSDRLQELLDDGWMILAICPQPDQRRPDYVLGKRERVTA